MAEYRRRDRKKVMQRKKRGPVRGNRGKMYRNTAAMVGRREFLKRLGFETYQDYLKSNLWVAIRRKVLELHKGLCVACGRKAEQVHHIRYDMATLSGQDLSGLCPLCEADHMFIEWKCGRKVSLKEANMRLTGLLMKRRMG